MPVCVCVRVIEHTLNAFFLRHFDDLSCSNFQMEYISSLNYIEQASIQMQCVQRGHNKFFFQMQCVVYGLRKSVQRKKQRTLTLMK